MKIILLIALFLVAASAKLYYCTDEENNYKTCPNSYHPVLAVYDNGEYDDFKNKYCACRKDNIKKYYKLYYCPKKYDKEGYKCPENHEPVCGYTHDYKLKYYKNECYACTRGIDYYIPGKCPNLKGHWD